MPDLWVKTPKGDVWLAPPRHPSLAKAEAGEGGYSKPTPEEIAAAFEIEYWVKNEGEKVWPVRADHFARILAGEGRDGWSKPTPEEIRKEYAEYGVEVPEQYREQKAEETEKRGPGRPRTVNVES